MTQWPMREAVVFRHLGIAFVVMNVATAWSRNDGHVIPIDDSGFADSEPNAGGAAD